MSPFSRLLSSHTFASVFLCYLLLPALNATAIIPPTQGTYATGLTTMKLTDKKRIDPYSPEQHRSVMLSAFFPVGLHSQCSLQVVPYMPPATACVQDAYYAPYGIPDNSFERLKLSVCTNKSHQAVPAHPLILFSPGLGNSRLIYSALAQSLAAHGHTVVTIDHPHDANVVEYPDGDLVFAANITTDQQILTALDVRVGDVSFILDSLADPNIVHRLVPATKAPLNTSHAVVVGHSLGGATASAVMLVDRRFVGGVDLDGSFFGRVVHEGLDQPFLLFGHEGKNQSTDDIWKALWGNLRGWKRELGLLGSQHATYSDLPVLVDVLGLRRMLAGVDLVLGSIGGERARVAVSNVLAAFGGLVKDGIETPLLNGRDKGWPEVVLVAK